MQGKEGSGWQLARCLLGCTWDLLPQGLAPALLGSFSVVASFLIGQGLCSGAKSRVLPPQVFTWLSSAFQTHLLFKSNGQDWDVARRESTCLVHARPWFHPSMAHITRMTTVAWAWLMAQPA